MNHLSLKENAYQIIKKKILNGEIKLGERIREDLLAAEISMSRTPVREAINQLDVEGIIVNIPRKGIYNIDFDEDEIINILELRESLETLAVTECTKIITVEQLEKLKVINENLKEAFEKKDYFSCSQLDRNFHNEIALTTGSKKLIKFLGEIGDYIQIMRNVTPDNYLESLKYAIEEHELIVECIETKNLGNCIIVVKKHINRMRKNMKVKESK